MQVKITAWNASSTVASYSAASEHVDYFHSGRSEMTWSMRPKTTTVIKFTSGTIKNTWVFSTGLLLARYLCAVRNYATATDTPNAISLLQRNCGITVTYARGSWWKVRQVWGIRFEKFQNVKYSMSALSNMKLNFKDQVIFYCLVKITAGFIYIFKFF